MGRPERSVLGLGMSLLVAGLVFALTLDVGGVDLAAGHVPPWKSMPPAYVVANLVWIVGAVLLIYPPLKSGFQLLVVLEVFLAASGLMAFWMPEQFWIKIMSRVGMSLAVVGYLKWRGLLSNISYPWSLVSPRFYYRAWRTGDNNALAVGIELLGIGYALSSMLMLTIGSAYLARGSWVTWRTDHQGIFLAWTGLNGLYVGSGIAIMIADLLG